MPLEQQRHLGMKALLIHEELSAKTAAGRAVRALSEVLEGRQVEVILAQSAMDAIAIIHSDPMVQCVLLDWDLNLDDSHEIAMSVLDAVRERSEAVPIFLLADRSSAATIALDAMQKSDDFIWLLEDTSVFIGGRIIAAIQRYRDEILPPMFGALVRFSQVYEYSWHTPGHTGGTAFLKSTVGRAFFDFLVPDLIKRFQSYTPGNKRPDIK